MSPAPPHSAYHVSRYDDDYDLDTFEEDDVPVFVTELSAGERIGTPLQSRRGNRVLRWSTVALICAGGAWASRDDTGTALAMLNALKTALGPVVERVATALAPPPAPPAPVAAPPPEPPPLPAAAEVAPASVPASSVEAPAPAADEPAASAPARPEPLAAPAVDETNPYQKRAAAAGLHPGISAAVLQRLTAADYRNAGVAIERALKETPDDEIFVWPKPAGAGAALFQIRFVQGSNAACRRYLVNVTKDGWSTTAPAIERCGIRTPSAKGAKTAAE